MVHDIGVQAVDIVHAALALHTVGMLVIRLEPRVGVSPTATVRLADHRVHFNMNLGEPVCPFVPYDVLIVVERVAADRETVKSLRELLGQRHRNDLNVVADVVLLNIGKLMPYGSVLVVIDLQFGNGEVKRLSYRRNLHGKFLERIFYCHPLLLLLAFLLEADLHLIELAHCADKRPEAS